MNDINQFQKAKNESIPISIVTCYDYWSAKIINSTEIDAVLIGDSAAMVMHGYNSTISATVEMIVTHVKAVRKGTNKLLIADVPFLTHQKGSKYFFASVDKLMKAGAQTIKIEGTNGTLEYIENLSKSGVPVIGHLGLTPQSINKFGGYKVQGRTENDSKTILNQAQNLENAGCSAIVLELIPGLLAKEITECLNIPTIGIGAGKHTSGQVLVFQDLLGMDDEFNPKFLKKYMNGFGDLKNSLQNYNREVKQRVFPSDKESF